MTVLQTSRLTLRPFVPADAAACVAIRYHPDVVPWVTPAPTEDPVAAEIRRIEEFSESFRVHGYGVFAVLETGGSAPIGHCGLRFLPELDATDVIWTIAPAAQGKGYAPEAAAAALAHGFDRCGLARIGALIRADNARSQGVAAKIGLGFQRSIEWRPGVIRGWWEIDRAQHAARPAGKPAPMPR